MFRIDPSDSGRSFRVAIAGLLTFSVAAFAVTIWVMSDFLREQQVVHRLIGQLPPKLALDAKNLEGELRWQFGLSLLVVLNLVVTALAMVLLSRAYGTSQASLRDLKARAGDILSSMDLVVLTTDVSGIVTSINRRGMELLELDDACVGQPLGSLTGSLPLDEFRQRSSPAVPDGPEVQDFSLHVNGHSRVLRAFCQPLRDHELQTIGSIIQLRDVTERVLVEDRLRRMERYMGLGSLAAGLHHEIRNPLAAVSLHVQLLEEEIETTGPSAEMRQMLSVIRTEITRVRDVLENFRDFASVGRLNTSAVNVAALIERQTSLVAPQAELQKVRIDLTVNSDLPVIDADSVRLEQVLLNLLVNALEAMPAGGSLAVRADCVQSPEAKDMIRILVSDTGPGIPDSIRGFIFDPYFTTKSQGTGMGLALCDKIVRQHGGQLELQPSDTGAVFELRLPAAGTALVESEQSSRHEQRISHSDC